MHKSCCFSCQFWVISIKLQRGYCCKSITDGAGFASEPYICSVDIHFHTSVLAMENGNKIFITVIIDSDSICLFPPLLLVKCPTLVVGRKKEKLCPLLRPTEMCPHADKHSWSESQSCDASADIWTGWLAGLWLWTEENKYDYKSCLFATGLWKHWSRIKWWLETLGTSHDSTRSNHMTSVYTDIAKRMRMKSVDIAICIWVIIYCEVSYWTTCTGQGDVEGLVTAAITPPHCQS